jgi:hypothetical protein
MIRVKTAKTRRKTSNSPGMNGIHVNPVTPQLRKEGSIVKKLISLALVFGFLCVGLGCGDTTKKGETSTTKKTTESTVPTPKDGK